ncbi:hypothetical protein E8E15_000724 [Penicillium rubens]|nr:hypothetical protein E8E15_000724 [Penicillium rubens]
MRLDHSIGHVRHDFQQNQAIDLWDDVTQYAPTPGYFRGSPPSLPDVCYSNIDPGPSIDSAPPQETSPKDTLPLLRFGDERQCHMAASSVANGRSASTASVCRTISSSSVDRGRV